jgi:hypothetical protein
MEQSPIEFYSTDSPQVTLVEKQKLVARDLQIEAAARNVYIKWLTEIFHDSCIIVPGCEPIQIGSHSGRMTFCMLGILGGGDPDRVRESARHVAGHVLDNYRGDACTFFESMLENQALESIYLSFQVQPQPWF